MAQVLWRHLAPLKMMRMRAAQRKDGSEAVSSNRAAQRKDGSEAVSSNRAAQRKDGSEAVSSGPTPEHVHMQAPQPHAREAELQDETEEDGGTAWQAKAWLQNMPIADVMSSALLRPLQLFLVKNKNPTITELEFLRGIAGLGSRDMLTGLFTAANLHEHLTDVLWRGLCDLEGSASADAASRELNSKFQVEEDCVTMQYGSDSSFFRGLEMVIGPPKPKLLDAMLREHCGESDSAVPFIARNFGTRTQSRIEWWFVYDPEHGLDILELGQWPVEQSLVDKGLSSHCRKPLPPNKFDHERTSRNVQLSKLGHAGLLIAELLAARLYTGPMYRKYQAVLRALGATTSAGGESEDGGLRTSAAAEEFATLCEGNRYTTTIHCLNSAIVKLSKIQAAVRVYRGVAKAALPASFWKLSSVNCRGAVEVGVLSMTTDKQVAMDYVEDYVRQARKSGRTAAGIVFAAKMGMVDRGSDLSWLSQYPHEGEIAFPPLSGIEVIEMKVESSCLVVDVRMDVNAAQTIEAAVSKMQRSVLQLIDIMTDELRLQGAPEPAVLPLSSLRKKTAALDSSFFNLTSNYRMATESALQARRGVISDIADEELWDDERSRLATLSAPPSPVKVVRSETLSMSGPGRRRTVRRLSRQHTPRRGPCPWQQVAEDAESAVEALQRVTSVAGRMTGLAELCAFEGEHRAAIELLLLSLAEEPLPPEEHAQVGEAVGADAGPETLSQLQVAQLLLRAGLQQPWPATLAHMLHGAPPLVLRATIKLAHALASRHARLEDDTDPGPGAIEPHTALGLLGRAPDGGGEREWLAARTVVLVRDSTHEIWRRAVLARRFCIGAPTGAGGEALVRLVDGERPELFVCGSDLHPVGPGCAYSDLLVDAPCGLGAMLREAAALGDTELLGGLISAGVAVDACNESVSTALHQAAANGHASACEMLLAAGARRHLRNKNARCADDLALEGGHWAAQRALVPSCSDREFEDFRVRGGLNSPVFAAVAAGNTAAIPPDVNTRGPCGVTPLMLAVHLDRHLDRLAMVDSLVAAGADPSLKSQRGCTPLGLAAEEDRPALFGALTAPGVHCDEPQQDGLTPLLLAAKRGASQCVCRLLATGADTTSRGEDGATALLLACIHHGEVSVVQALLRSCPSLINQGDASGLTCLMAAARFGHEEALDFLLAFDGERAQVSAAAKDGMTALHFACQRVDENSYEDEAIVHALLRHDANIEARSADGSTPLMLAASHGDEAVVHALLQHGATVETVRRDGMTALKLAALHGRERVVAAILEKAPENAFLHDETVGATARALALRGGHAGLARQLRRDGASPLHSPTTSRFLNEEGENGRTCRSPVGLTSDPPR